MTELFVENYHVDSAFAGIEALNDVIRPKELPMSWRIQLWRNGPVPEGDEEHRVEAATAKEAAEKAFGHHLFEDGSNYQLRAVVRRTFSQRCPSSQPILFYTR